ncbi:hypothetical protein OIU79_001334, partial [Salix purpurea]
MHGLLPQIGNSSQKILLIGPQIEKFKPRRKSICLITVEMKDHCTVIRNTSRQKFDQSEGPGRDEGLITDSLVQFFDNCVGRFLTIVPSEPRASVRQRKKLSLSQTVSKVQLASSPRKIPPNTIRSFKSG